MSDEVRRIEWQEDRPLESEAVVLKSLGGSTDPLRLLHEASERGWSWSLGHDVRNGYAGTIWRTPNHLTSYGVTLDEVVNSLARFAIDLDTHI